MNIAAHEPLVRYMRRAANSRLSEMLHYFGKNSGGSRGGSGGSNEHPLEPKLFHFHGEFQEKIGQSAQIEPPSANLNPRSKIPGSGPEEYQTEI